MEIDNKMDFLDNTTSNNRSRLEISIFLKPTTTDNTVLWQIIAVNLQNIKHAAIRYFATRMNQYLREMQRDKENVTVWTNAMICYLRVHLSWPLDCNSHINVPKIQGVTKWSQLVSLNQQYLNNSGGEEAFVNT